MNFLLPYLFFFDLSRLRYLNNRKSNTLICLESGLAWFPGCSSCAGFNWFNPHLVRVSSMNAFWTITIRSHSGYFSRGIHFLWGRRHCPHCYLNFGWLSVFFSFFLFGNLSRFALIAFLHCCRLLCFPRVFHSILHYWEGIRLFTTLLHLLRCICGHLFFAYATKRRGSAVSSFPFALIIIVGTV